MNKQTPTAYSYAPISGGGKLQYELGNPNNIIQLCARQRIAHDGDDDSSTISSSTVTSAEGSAPHYSDDTDTLPHQPGAITTTVGGDCPVLAEQHESPEPPVLRNEGVPRCRCGKCTDMPRYIENKCCQDENIDNTHLSDFQPGTCLLNCEEIQHTLLTVNVRCAWMRQRRYFGFTGPALAFTHMNNKNYRYHAYRCYIDYMHGLLGKFKRKVIPACVVDHIRSKWPEEDNNYVGFVDVDENGVPMNVDELAELAGD